MSIFTKRIDANIRDVGHAGSPLESSATTIGNPGAVVRELSLRFIGVTVPQAATISSAKITFTAGASATSETIAMKIRGVDEDNTAEFVISPEDTARTRTHTTAAVDWDETLTLSVNEEFDTADITSVIQEIVDRGSWSSGNAIGIYVQDDGTGSGNTVDSTDYSTTAGEAALLTIDYVSESASPSLSESRSPSATPSESSSPSLSPSLSPSASFSASPSPSSSPSRSPSSSASPSPSPEIPFTGLRVAKLGNNVLTQADPDKLTFSSEYSTLKYFAKTNVIVQIDANDGDVSAEGTVAHNLTHFPFVEVYVRVYIGAPAGSFEYCPFFGSGATVLYKANYRIENDEIKLYANINGVSTSLWNFDFLVFIYKNDLGF